jgi:hypothetical protein
MTTPEKKKAFQEVKTLISKMCDIFGKLKTSQMLETSRKNLYNILTLDHIDMKDGNVRRLKAMAIMALTNAELVAGASLATKRRKELAKGKGLSLSISEIINSTSILPEEYDEEEDLAHSQEDEDEDEMP